MADEKKELKKEDKFIITGEQIITITSALGELPAKISYPALRIFESLQKQND